MERFDYFEEILDRCITDVQSGTRTIEDCLAAYPQYRDQLEPLLTLSQRLSSGRNVMASAAFKDNAVSRFRKASEASSRTVMSPYPIGAAPQQRSGVRVPLAQSAASDLTSKRTSTTRWIGLVIAISMLVVVFIVGTGVAFAANNSLPGSRLYPLKLTIEQANLDLSVSDGRDFRLHQIYSQRRLSEAEALLVEHKDRYLNSVFANYNQHVMEMTSILSAGALSAEDRAALAARMVDGLAQDETRLSGIYNLIPPDQRAIIDQALDNARRARDVAREVSAEIPALRDRIRLTLVSTLSAPSATPTSTEAMVGGEPPVRNTPTPDATQMISVFPSPIWTPIIPYPSTDWITGTPDWSRIATLHPSQYPTLSSLATQYPNITKTPRPRVNPTRTRPEPRTTPRPKPTIVVTPPVIPIP